MIQCFPCDVKCIKPYRNQVKLSHQYYPYMVARTTRFIKLPDPIYFREALYAVTVSETNNGVGFPTTLIWWVQSISMRSNHAHGIGSAALDIKWNDGAILLAHLFPYRLYWKTQNRWPTGAPVREVMTSCIVLGFSSGTWSIWFYREETIVWKAIGCRIPISGTFSHADGLINWHACQQWNKCFTTNYLTFRRY